MIIKPIKTARIEAGVVTLQDLIEQHLNQMTENSILVITSKVVSLCENRVEPLTLDKNDLVHAEADYYTDAVGPYGFHFTITKNILIPSAGIDESNTNQNYVLWPLDAQKTANEIRAYLATHFGLSHVGVIISDSTCSPMRRGTTGIAIAHSGFLALKNYVGTPDLFGRRFRVSQANISTGLAAAAVVAMGEGTEQTPLCLIEGLESVEFQDRDPSSEELTDLRIEIDEDIFAPFLRGVEWQQGHKK